jgi:hypothetical protein
MKMKAHIPVKTQGRYGYKRVYMSLTLYANNYVIYISAQDSGGEESLVPFILLMVLRFMLLYSMATKNIKINTF